MRRTIPIAPAGEPAAQGCSAEEPFALVVLGDAMAPEFVAGDVIVIEPEGYATDGSFVVAQAGGEWYFRKLAARGEGWRLEALDARYPPIDIPGLACVRGVVIQKSRPGRRRATRFYGGGTAGQHR